jgi:hypothetical protein
VPKIALNRSWFDATSAEFFRGRTLKVRGTIDDGAIAIRTVWPEDFRIGYNPPPLALDAGLSQALALRGLMRAEGSGGAKSPYAVSTLWQRNREREPVPPGRAVLGLIVNGAQGDDDEAHGGHFALVTGRTREDGAIGDWLVNNFYALDSESEKGIIAAPVPLDNYLADLNSGQGWYRPSQLLVLALADDRAAVLVQAALNRVYNQFWRHQLAYRHASMNCAGISVDVLRALGWDIPVRGPAGRVAAALGFPYIAVKERSIAKARVAFDYLTEDQTRLLPAAAFEECGAGRTAAREIGQRRPRLARDPRANAGRRHRRHRIRSHTAVPIEPRLRRCARWFRRGNSRNGCPPIARSCRSFLCRPGRFPIRCALRI